MIIFALIKHNDPTFLKGSYYDVEFVGKEISEELKALEEQRFSSPFEAMSLLGEYDFNLCDTVYLSGGIGYRHIWMSKLIQTE